jgi:hypothetical protein
MAVLYTPHFVQFEDSDGNPLSGGKLYTYAAGTTTNKATFTTAAGDIQNANPVVLDAAGRAVIFIEGSYRFDLFDANDDLIKSVDNVTSFTTLPESSNAFFQSFSGNGTNTAFTLSEDLGTDEKTLLVYVDNSNLEYVTNGSFATDTDWTKGSGWVIGSGVATATTASSALSQTSAFTLVQGTAYVVTYTITRSAGSVIASIGGADGTSRNASGTYTEIIIASSTQTIAFTGTGFSGTVDDVSVKLANGKGYEIQNPNSYTLDGTSLTLTVAPAAGTNNVFVFAPSLLTGAASAAAAAAQSAEAGALAAQAEAEAAAGLTEVTSTSSVAIGTGAKSFTVGAGLFLAAGQFIHITSDADPEVNSMWGTVTSYSGTSLVTNIEAIRGSGTYADWTMRLTGERGEQGATGSISDLSGVPSGTAALDDTIIFTDVNDSNTRLKKQRINALPFISALNGGVQLRNNAGDLTLFPYLGGLLDINGTLVQVPAAGWVVDDTSASNDTTYYIYATTTGAEYSATAYEFDSDTGIPYQIGEPSKVLVGMARYGTGAWETSDALIRSYYNDKGAVVENDFTANRTTASTSVVEVNTEIRTLYLVWDGETVIDSVAGTAGSSLTNNGVSTQIGRDGTTPIPGQVVYYAYGNGAARGNCSLTVSSNNVTEGYHYSTLLGNAVVGGTATWHSSGGDKTVLRTILTGRK